MMDSAKQLTRKALKIGVVIAALAAIAFASRFPSYTLEKNLVRVNKEWRELRTAMAAYGMDRCGIYYPPDTSERRKEQPSLQLTFETLPDYLTNRPVGYDGKPRELWNPLTTPLAYATVIPKDPFHPGQYYSYASWNMHNELMTMSFLHSPGPNRRNEIEPERLREEIERYLKARPFGNAFGMMDQDLSAFKRIANEFIYDPTNGTKSRGDLIVFNNAAYDSFGWRNDSNGRWEKAPYPDKPIFADTGISKSWEVGDALPDPVSFAEELSRTRKVAVPHSMAEAMRWSGYKANSESKADVTALNVIQNMFGREFPNFFRSPRALTSDEALLFQSKLEEGWWSIMKRCGLLSGRPETYIPASETFVFLPLYGKSQILYAGFNLHEGNAPEALLRLKYMEEVIREMRKSDAMEPDAYEAQVYSVLERLIEELSTHIPEAEKGGRE